MLKRCFRNATAMRLNPFYGSLFCNKRNQKVQKNWLAVAHYDSQPVSCLIYKPFRPV